MPGFPPHFTRALFLITEITHQKEGGQADYADNSSGELPTLPSDIHQMNFFYNISPLRG
jgi:hypothetical protein